MLNMCIAYDLCMYDMPNAQPSGGCGCPVGVGTAGIFLIAGSAVQHRGGQRGTPDC
jgi:hypothetical protein